MSKHARLSVEDHVIAGDRLLVRRKPLKRTRYFAFLSYSHDDEEIADWLHRELEKFRVPHALSGRLTEHGAIPKRLTPIFRDRHELSAADDLADEIEAALASSQFLIVLCSPTAATSRWTNAEVESFKRNRPEGCVLAVIASGEPFASDIPGREAEECFPPALRYKYDRRGRATHRRAEPLAADLRGGYEEQRIGLLKLIAGMLGVGLDELVQRETTRRHRHLGWLAAASLGGMAVTSTLAVAAIHGRNEAREQRREAEGLVGFMLGDLKDKLEPIGRLDALDGVGARVLAYYSKQNKTDLSDAALSQRSRALSLMAQVADSRGDTDSSLRLYREAMSGTAEAIRRNPDNPQAIYEHAQNVFQVGELTRNRGEFKAAETAYREYQRLAERMVALQPDNLKWRIEEEDAQANVGIVLFNQRQFAEAERQFRKALSTIEAVVAVDPTTAEYQQALTETLAWLADAQGSRGHLDEAIATRQRQVELLKQLIARSNNDVSYRARLIPAYQSLGRIMLAKGDTGAAIGLLQAAVEVGDQLLPSEPQNTNWRGSATSARLSLAEAQLVSGDVPKASSSTNQACADVQRLISHDRSVVSWQRSLRSCFSMRAQIALRGGAYGDALSSSRRAIQLTGSDRTVQGTPEVAMLHRLAGDASARLGNQDEARAEWQSGLGILPNVSGQRPNEMAESVALMQRLGMDGQWQPIASRLNDMGYKKIARQEQGGPG